MTGNDRWRQLYEQRPEPAARRFTLIRTDGDDVAGWLVGGRCEVDEPAPDSATVSG